MVEAFLFISVFLSQSLSRAATISRPSAVHRVVDDPIHAAAQGWRSEALKALDVQVEEGRCVEACRVTVTVDRARLMGAVPLLQDHGSVPKSLSLEEIEKRPAFYDNALSLLLVSWAVHDTYSAQPDLGATRWAVQMSPPPGGATRSTGEIFSFEEDRALYRQTNWDRLTFAEFPRAVTGFSYNLRFTLEMSREAGGGIDQD